MEPLIQVLAVAGSVVILGVLFAALLRNERRERGALVDRLNQSARFDGARFDPQVIRTYDAPAAFRHDVRQFRFGAARLRPSTTLTVCGFPATLFGDLPRGQYNQNTYGNRVVCVVDAGVGEGPAVVCQPRAFPGFGVPSTTDGMKFVLWPGPPGSGRRGVFVRGSAFDDLYLPGLARWAKRRFPETLDWVELSEGKVVCVGQSGINYERFIEVYAAANRVLTDLAGLEPTVGVSTG